MKIIILIIISVIVLFSLMEALMLGAAKGKDWDREDEAQMKALTKIKKQKEQRGKL